MVYGGGLLGLVELCLVLYCVLNVITTPEADVRNLPKPLWLLLVVVVPIVGGIAWLVAGRPQGPARSLPHRGRVAPPEYDRPGPATAASPDDDAAFLRSLKERAEAQRRQAEAERRAREGDA